MAYCRKCGKEIDDEAVICVHCGVPTNPANEATTQEQKQSQSQNEQTGNTDLSGKFNNTVNMVREELGRMKQNEPNTYNLMAAFKILSCLGVVMSLFFGLWIFIVFSLPSLVQSIMLFSKGYERTGKAILIFLGFIFLFDIIISIVIVSLILNSIF